MSAEVIPEEVLKIEADPGDIGLYRFDNKVAKHYFCKNCGIYIHNRKITFSRADASKSSLPM